MPYKFTPPGAQIQTTRPGTLTIGPPQIGLALDRSGSMSDIRTEVIAGVNNLLDEQRAKSADSRFSLVLFNDRVEIVHEAVPVSDVPLLTAETYVPYGGTALNDSIAATIEAVGKHTSRVTPTLIAIVTDGCDVSSRQFRNEDIREMIAYRRKNHQWEFIFLGPSSARDYARQIGIPEEHFVRFDASAEGMTAILDQLSKAMGRFSLGERNYALRLQDKS